MAGDDVVEFYTATGDDVTLDEVNETVETWEAAKRGKQIAADLAAYYRSGGRRLR